MAGYALSAVLPKIEDAELEYKKYLNFLVALRERRQLAGEVSSLPFEVTVDLSTICHLHCPYCATGNQTIDRQRMLMKVEMHRQILKELEDKAFIIWYFSCGEPLLNPDACRLISQTKGREIFSGISTNLSMSLSDERIDSILGSGLGMISVSLDGACEETYSQYRRGGKFDLVVGNLRRLVERKRQLGLQRPLLEWRYLIFQHNEHEVDRVRQAAEELGVDLLELFPGCAPEKAPPGAVQRYARPIHGPTESGPALRAGVSRTDTTLRRIIGPRVCDGPSRIPDHLFTPKCDWLYFASMIYPDGAHAPCCVLVNRGDDFGMLGPSTSFREVWNNRKFRDARRLFDGDRDAGKDLPCASCAQPRSLGGQFRNGFNGILLNAPDWAIFVLAADPDSFFFPVDYRLLPNIDRLVKVGRESNLSFPAVAKRLKRDAAGSTPWSQHAKSILNLLAAEPSPASWWRRLWTRRKAA
jgi:MoaA/NifB/PqqE/SkfB family radical SAM enzyme